MDSLNLGARPLITLPASAFPNRADVYVCEKCGRDLTKHLRASRAHVWAPMGRERFRCACGQGYLTGATEWDHFSEWERKRRVGESLVIGVLLSATFSIPGFLICLDLRFVLGLREGALVTGFIITALPFLFLNITFWPFVVASMWRTRIGTSVVSQRN